MKAKWYEAAKLQGVIFDDQDEVLRSTPYEVTRKPEEVFWVGASVPVESARLGFGCNTFSGEIRARALVAEDALLDQGAIQGQEKRFYLDLIKSKHELHDKMEVSASASYSGLFSVSAKSQFVHDQSLNQESVYLLVRVLVANSRTRFSDYRPTESVLKFVTADSVDWNQFVSRYGDEFIDQLVTGGEFYALYEFHTSSIQQKNALEAQLRGKGWGFSAEAEFKQSLREIDTNVQVTCKLYIRGGKDRLPEITDDKIIDAALNFPQAVSPDSGGAVIYQAITQDYNIIDGFPGFPENVQQNLDNSRALSQAISSTLARSEDFESALAVQQSLDPVTKRKIADVRTHLTTVLQDIAKHPLFAHAHPTHLVDALAAIEQQHLWRAVPGSPFAQVSVGSYQHVWALTPDDAIWKWNGVENHWESLATGRLRKLSVGADGTVWGVNSADEVYRWDFARWTNIGGRLSTISVGNANHVWGINRNGHVFQFLDSRWIDRTTPQLRGSRLVTAGSDGTVMIVAANGLFKWNPDSNAFSPVAGRLAHVSVGRASEIWGIDLEGRAVKCNGESWTPLPGERKLKTLSAGDDGTVWGIDGQGAVFSLNNTLIPEAFPD